MESPARCVFVVGAPRSGTSAFSWALAEHEALWTSAESDWMGMLFGDERIRRVYERGTQRGPRHWLSKHEVGFDEWAAALGSGIDELYRRRSGGLIWVEQTPAYAVHVETLAALFPEARFIHLLRDGTQVVHSLIHSGFDVDLAQSFHKACEAWVGHVRGALAGERAHPTRVLRIRHDRLVEDPDAVCDEVLAFLGLEASTAPADYLRETTINSSFPEARRATARSFEATPAEGWSRWQRLQFRRIAGRLMRELGF